MNNEKFSSIDTETIKGKCKVVCNENEGIFVNTFDDVMDFIFSKCNKKIVTYNVDYDVLAILKYLPKYCFEDILMFGITKYKQYVINYEKQGKECIVTYRRQQRFLYDVMQFFNSSLDVASQKFLNEKKIDISLEGITKFIHNKNNKVIEYCIQDAKLTLKLWGFLQAKFKALKINSNRPLSLAFLSYNYFKHYFKKEKITRTCNDYFQLGYYGGRFEILQRGYFRNACLYDLNSAYPSAINQLYSLNGAEYVKNENITKDTIYGLFYLELDFREFLFLPLPLRQGNGKIIFPYGQFRGYYTLEDIKLLDKYHYKYKILENICVHNEKKKIIDINYYYTLRKKKVQLDYVLKIMLNSLYGKFAQKTNKKFFKGILSDSDVDLFYSKEEFGGSTNFIFASFITSYIRRVIYDYAMLFSDKVIFFNTDGILFSDDIVNIKDSNKLGGMCKKDYKGAYVIGSGIYGLIKSDDIIEWKRRGLQIDSKLLNNLKDSKNKYVELNSTKRIGLTENNLRLNYNLNEITNVLKKVNFNFDNKRLWFSDFKNGSEIFTRQIQSKPIKLNLELYSKLVRG